MERHDKAGLRLWAYPRSVDNPIEEAFTTVTIGLKSDVINQGLGAGGNIEQWLAADNSEGYNQLILSQAGMSRGINQVVVRIEADGTEYHIHSAASKFDGAGQHGSLSENWTISECKQGAPLTFSKIDQITPNTVVRFRTKSAGIEWDPNGTIFGTDHYGDFLNPIIYPDVRFATDLTLNTANVTGLHTITQTTWMPDDASAGDYTRIVSPEIKFAFKFDQLYTYDGSSYTQIAIQPMESAFGPETPAIVAYPGGDLIAFSTSVVKDRHPGTNEPIIFSGWSGGPPSLDGTRLATWTSSFSFSISLPGQTADYTGGTIEAKTKYYAQWNDTEVRQMYTDDVAVGEPADHTPIGDVQSGLYVGRSLLRANSANAMIYRMVSSGVNNWSQDEDFAVALFVGKGVIGARSDLGDGGRKCFRYGVERFVGAPDGSPLEHPYALMSIAHEWTANSARMKRGPRVQISRLLMGSYAHVQALIALLDP